MTKGGRVRLLLPGAALFTLLAIAMALSSSAARAAASQAWQAKIDTTLLTPLAGGGDVEFLVLLEEQADLSAAAALPTKLAKGEFVYARLTAVARRTQPALIRILDSQSAPYRRFWVRNMLWVRGDAGLAETLARDPETKRILANPRTRLVLPTEAPLVRQSNAVDNGVEWNIALIGAPEVWAAGVTGQGAVVGGQDTGYDWTHPALINQYRGWDGQSADHDYNWHDAIHAEDVNTFPGNPCGYDSPEPCDDQGHGTHTMGTMVGDDGLNKTGVAPGARWIGCRNMEQGWGTPASYMECYEWFIAPYPAGGDSLADGDPAQAPDVINNSWSCPTYEGCTQPEILQGVVESVTAAGIVTAHSAGNSGPACNSVNTPAAIYDASFSVGATDRFDLIAGFSSRGVVTVDGSNRPKPDISAPGVSVRSTTPNGGFSSLSGTSMAAPHVAGVAALLISAEPALAGHVADIERLIQQSAVPLAAAVSCGDEKPGAVPNNTYGWGRIDALSALEILRPADNLKVNKAAAVASVAPGANLTYTLSVSNVSAATVATNLLLTDTLPAGTELVSATPPASVSGRTVTWQEPSLGPQQQWQVSLTVRVPLSTTALLVQNDQYGLLATGLPEPVTGPPIVTHIDRPLASYHIFLVFPAPIRE